MNISDFLHTFTNREIAVAIWILAALMWSLTKSDLRRSLWGVAKAVANLKILIPLGLLGFYVFLLTAVLQRFHLWNLELLKDTIVWFLGTAIVLFMNALKAIDEPTHFTKTAFEVLKFTTIVEFLFDMYVLPLPAELILVPVFVFLGGSIAVAGTKQEFAQVGKLLIGCLNLIVLSLIAFALFEAISHAADFHNFQTYREFLLAPVLTIATIPFFYLFALIAEYEQQFMRLWIWLGDDPIRVKKCKLMIFRYCGLSLSKLRPLRGNFYVRIVRAKTDRSIRATVRNFSRRKIKASLDSKEA